MCTLSLTAKRAAMRGSKAGSVDDPEVYKSKRKPGVTSMPGATSNTKSVQALSARSLRGGKRLLKAMVSGSSGSAYAALSAV